MLLSEDRFTMQDTLADMIHKLVAENNKDSLICLCKILLWDYNRCEEILTFFDDFGIYEQQISIFFNLCCSQKLETLHNTIADIRAGKISQQELSAMLLCDNRMPIISG